MPKPTNVPPCVPLPQLHRSLSISIYDEIDQRTVWSKLPQIRCVYVYHEGCLITTIPVAAFARLARSPPSIDVNNVAPLTLGRKVNLI